jgi:hypothetical protein
VNAYVQINPTAKEVRGSCRTAMAGLALNVLVGATIDRVVADQRDWAVR